MIIQGLVPVIIDYDLQHHDKSYKVFIQSMDQHVSHKHSSGEVLRREKAMYFPMTIIFGTGNDMITNVITNCGTDMS